MSADVTLAITVLLSGAGAWLLLRYRARYRIFALYIASVTGIGVIVIPASMDGKFRLWWVVCGAAAGAAVYAAWLVSWPTLGRLFRRYLRMRW
jgi:hypothetical protein